MTVAAAARRIEPFAATRAQTMIRYLLIVAATALFLFSLYAFYQEVQARNYLGALLMLVPLVLLVLFLWFGTQAEGATGSA